MDDQQQKLELRTRDFWAALVLITVSAFFLWQTAIMPAGLSSQGWYDAAPLVPSFIFGAMFILSISLLVVAIKEGGAKNALSKVGIGWNPDEAWRFGTVAVMLFFYVAALVPRVDFIIASGLLITGLIYGYRGGYRRRMGVSALVLAVAGSYAMAFHLGRGTWSKWDDDILALVLWIGLTIQVLRACRDDRTLRVVPVMAIGAPLILVCAMAFGFRQNVPAREGLFFSQIQYHYYVTLKPLWSK